MCISMNAADERSLEAIRQKIFPFLRASWDALQILDRDKQRPRFIILDECETLTEAAQLSLQTILDKDPKEVCVILICNSQSRIHQKLRQRLLRIRYDPPTKPKIWQEVPLLENGSVTKECIQRDAFHEITRGDLRLTSKRPEIEARLWSYLHHHPDEILKTIQASNTDYMTILTEILLLMNLLFILDEQVLELINLTLPFIYANVKPELIQNQIKRIVLLWQQKFDEHARS